jgi:hypothetical protein
MRPTPPEDKVVPFPFELSPEFTLCEGYVAYAVAIQPIVAILRQSGDNNTPSLSATNITGVEQLPDITHLQFSVRHKNGTTALGQYGVQHVLDRFGLIKTGATVVSAEPDRHDGNAYVIYSVPVKRA